MSTVSPLNMPIEEVVCYVRRESPAVGAVFVSLNGDRCMIPDGWLSRAELTDDETLLTLHYPAGTLSIRGHELNPLFDDAVARAVALASKSWKPPPGGVPFVGNFRFRQQGTGGAR